MINRGQVLSCRRGIWGLFEAYLCLFCFCVSSGRLKLLSLASKNALAWFLTRHLLVKLALRGCCHTCLPWDSLDLQKAKSQMVIKMASVWLCVIDMYRKSSGIWNIYTLHQRNVMMLKLCSVSLRMTMVNVQRARTTPLLDSFLPFDTSWLKTCLEIVNNQDIDLNHCKFNKMESTRLFVRPIVLQSKDKIGVPISPIYDDIDAICSLISGETCTFLSSLHRMGKSATWKLTQILTLSFSYCPGHVLSSMMSKISTQERQDRGVEWSDMTCIIIDGESGNNKFVKMLET